MRYINILFTKARVLTIKDNRLQIIDSEGQLKHYPLEDINSLVLEHRQMSLSARVLSECAAHGIALFVCDDKFTPNGVLTPFNSHFQKPKIMQLQLSTPKPLQKRVWQALIRQKIKNHASVLDLYFKDGASELKDLAKEVHSGDTGNVEAIAARKYFISLFGKGFTRESEIFANACLNYVYAVLRGTIARALVVYGFEPSLGLNHASSLNAFNLADDLIEPFRPIGDLLAYSLIEKEPPSFLDENGFALLQTEHKKELLKIFQTGCSVHGQVCSINYAIEKLVQSLKQTMQEQEVLLDLPQIIPLRQVRYE